ncbi:SWI/SNF complex subunit SWI3B isoform X1 [Brachypodium distachyon]|uniref:SWI/SNF complex subunit SWI3B isoform X1 n=1 Tax=Brachypodium distachyon TaxID=15368 RepID=UPI0001C7394B|nr:SWI/SNF complex subunit SWI3B isoform X1 [Brachypodium distachyon]|eukprot:XP_024318089.1 SWI/SNF complex subunit SWI3B isoform X1 [Brachypodium distachyon]
MATPPAATATNSAPTPPKPPYKAPPFSQPPSTAGAGKTETPAASTSTAAAAVVAAVAATGAAAEEPSYIITVPSYSAWFSYDSVSDTERRLMPEFFQGEAAAASGSRGPEAYKYYRDTLVKRFRVRPERRLTLTEARRGLIGDIGSVRRVFDFLEEWGLINYGVSLPGVKQGRDKREEPVAPQSSLPAGVSAPKKLCIGCRTVCGQAYFTCEKADITICCRCYVRANYRPGLTPADFKKVETSEDAKSDWTDKETLHLLEAVMQYGEDWKKISEHVGSRSEKDCIARLLRLPFGEQFMGPKEDKMQFETDDDITDESRAEISKRVRLTPLADASNPIMAQVAFLSAIVGSDVATAAAQAAISAQSQVDETNDSPADSSIGSPKEEVSSAESCYTNGFSANDLLKEASANARVQLEKERKDIEQSLSDIVDVQMKEIQAKICRFEQKELLMEKERQQLHYLQKLLFADQLAVVQHQCRPHAVTAENEADENPKPVLTS